MNIDIDITDIEIRVDKTNKIKSPPIKFCSICQTTLEDNWDMPHNLDDCLMNFQKRIRTLEERLGIK